MSLDVVRKVINSKNLLSYTMVSNTTTSPATAGRAAGLCWVALGQHVYRCLEGDPDPNQCFGMAKWDALGKLWGQSWLGLTI